jgi:hypothetical protein
MAEQAEQLHRLLGRDAVEPLEREAASAQPAVQLSRACDVRQYAGLPPHGLSNEQMDEVLEEVQRSKRAGRASDKTVHGWRVMYTLRRQGTTANRGDICVIDPRDGQKIYSIVGLERKMGRIQALPWAPPAVRAPARP